MSNTPNPLIGFGFLMTAFDLRSLFLGTRPTPASEPTSNSRD